MIQELDAEYDLREESKGASGNKKKRGMSRNDMTKNSKNKVEPKFDLLPNEPPKRSRLEILALPKSRPTEKNEHR